MARDYSLNTVVPSPGTPIGWFMMGQQRVEVLVTEDWRQQWFERVGTALFGPTGEDDVTASIPTGSYLANVTVTANRGLSVTGTPGPGWTANIVQSQDLRTSASPQFANLVVPGTVDGRDVSADGSKLDTIATGATANSSDATLLARANHTGTQTAATISDFNTAADARVSAGIATHEAASDPHTGYQRESQKNASSGYAGLNGSSRITKGADASDDLIVDDATKGLVLKDTQGTPHYWRVTVDNTGALVITDLGTTKP